VAVLAFIRQRSQLHAVHYTLGSIGLVLVALPALAACQHQRGLRVNRRRDPDRAPLIGTRAAEEFRIGPWPCSFAGYLVAKRMARAAGGGYSHRPAPGPGPGAVLIAWGVSLVRAGLRGRCRHVALFRPVRGLMYFVPTSALLAIIGFRWSSRGPCSRASCSPTSGTFRPGLHPFSAAHCPVPTGLRPCTGWASAACSAAGWAMASPTTPRWCRTT